MEKEFEIPSNSFSRGGIIWNHLVCPLNTKHGFTKIDDNIWCHIYISISNCHICHFKFMAGFIPPFADNNILSTPPHTFFFFFYNFSWVTFSIVLKSNYVFYFIAYRQQDLLLNKNYQCKIWLHKLMNNTWLCCDSCCTVPLPE